MSSRAYGYARGVKSDRKKGLNVPIMLHNSGPRCSLHFSLRCRYHYYYYYYFFFTSYSRVFLHNISVCTYHGQCGLNAHTHMRVYVYFLYIIYVCVYGCKYTCYILTGFSYGSEFDVLSCENFKEKNWKIRFYWV